MKIQTQKFITKTDLFEGFDEIETWWNEKPHDDFTWGDCNRSMISPNNVLSPNIQWQDIEEYCTNTTEADWDRFLERLAGIPDDVMIDLEN
jgi:hypothetical protein